MTTYYDAKTGETKEMDTHKWDMKDLFMCVQYGKLYYISKVEGNHILCYRMHRKNGQLHPEKKPRIYKMQVPVEEGQLIFIDHQNFTTVMNMSKDFFERGIVKKI